MSEPYEEFEVNGYTVKLYPDDTESGAGNPRDADNLGVMMANGHRNYTLGDAEFSKHIPEYEQGAELLARLHEEHGAFSRRGGNGVPWEVVVESFKQELGATVVLPLWLLDHSGLAMRTGAFGEDPGQWDSGIVGVIYDTPRTRKMCGTPPELIEQVLRDEVKCYDMYIQGDVWGYVIEDPNGEETDSCWGFLGLDHCKEEATSAAEHSHSPLREEALAGPPLDALQRLVHEVASREATEVLGRGEGLRYLVDHGLTTEQIRERLGLETMSALQPPAGSIPYAGHGPGYALNLDEFTMSEPSPARSCLRCKRDLTNVMGCYIFVDGKPVDGLLCVEHGSNGANNLSLRTYERLTGSSQREEE